MRDLNRTFITLGIGLALFSALSLWLQFHPELWRAS